MRQYFFSPRIARINTNFIDFKLITQNKTKMFSEIRDHYIPHIAVSSVLYAKKFI